MTNEELLDKKIENYIHNRMTTGDRSAFEEQLKADEQLRKHVKILLSLVSLYDEELLQLKKKLDETEQQLEKDDFFKEKDNNPQ